MIKNTNVIIVTFNNNHKIIIMDNNYKIMYIIDNRNYIKMVPLIITYGRKLNRCNRSN